eukprot:3791748-Alexandrium_andersonii.AAC.1
MSLENQLTQCCIWRPPALGKLSCGPENERRAPFGDRPLLARSHAVRRMSIESRSTQCCVWRSPALGTLSCGPENELES